MKFRMLIVTTLLLLIVSLVVMGRQLYRQHLDNAFVRVIQHQHTAEALSLLKQGADPNAREPLYADETPVDMVKHLLKRWRGQTDMKKDYGASALQLAVQKDEVPVIKALLERGARDINARIIREGRDEGDQLLVVQVTRNKHPELTWEFLKHGAVLSKVDKEVLLWAAAESGNAELARYMLDNGTDVNGGAHVGEYGELNTEAPLLEAVSDDHIEIVRILLMRGAKVNIQYSGQKPLVRAAENNDHEMVKLLLTYGAKVNQTERFGNALCYASENRNLNVVKTLIAAGADVNANGYGGPVLFHAIGPGNAKVVTYLLEHGANTESRIRYGLTPLIEAAASGDNSVVRVLIAHGANVNAYSSRCETPLTKACEEGHLETARLLLSHGARVRIVAYWSWGPVDEDNPPRKIVDALKLAKTPEMKRLLRRYAH